MQLPIVVLKALIETKNLYSYGFFWLVMTLIELTQQTIMAHILTDTDTDTDIDTDIDFKYKYVMVLMILIVPVLRYNVFANKLSTINDEVKRHLWEISMGEYDELTTESKTNFPTRDLTKKLDDAEWGYAYWIEYGFPMVFNSISMSYLCVYTFYLSKMIYLLFLLTLGIVVLYFCIKKNLDKKMAKIWDDNRQERDKLNQRFKLEMPRFAYGSKTINDIMSIANKNFEIDSRFVKIRNDQKILSSLITEICVVIILLMPFDNLTGILAVTLKFTSTVNNLFGILNNNTHLEGQYTAFRKEFDKAKKQKYRVKQVDFDGEITIESCEIKKNGFELKLEEQFTYGIGDVMRFSGESGSGKSSFIKAAFVGDDDAEIVLLTKKQKDGRNKGLKKLNRVTRRNRSNKSNKSNKFDRHMKPKNYFHKVSWLHQNSKQELFVSKLTLSEIFDNTQDEKLVDKCLQLARVGKPIDRIKKKSLEKISEKKSENKSENESWLNIELSEIGEMSGGEMTRLAIAIHLFEVITRGKKILIMDEPEQGTDPPVAYKMIGDIIEEFRKTCVIILISHLEKYSHGDGGNIKWTKSFNVSNGLVTKMQ
jgi:ABC-type transport system involved in cytochrome bd biosynthesis fused ATPase/permease subunit